MSFPVMIVDLCSLWLLLNFRTILYIFFIYKKNNKKKKVKNNKSTLV